jgi:hypothetical protein
VQSDYFRKVLYKSGCNSCILHRFINRLGFAEILEKCRALRPGWDVTETLKGLSHEIETG